LFEGTAVEELKEKFALEYAHFEKCIKFNGRYWARPPLGESRFDVCQRVANSLATFQTDLNKQQNDLVIVSHGVTLRALVMMYLNRTPEWFEAERNPKNCALRLIVGDRDRGYMFDGFGDGK